MHARRPPFCVVSDLGITPVSPAWMQEGSVYLGQKVIHGILCEVWDKAEGPGGDAHIYAVAADDNRTPIQMLTTGQSKSKRFSCPLTASALSNTAG